MATGCNLGAWGSGEVTDPHGLEIIGDTVYTTDRSDSVAKSFTLDGKPLLELGQRGTHSDTGNITNWLAERAAGPFNHPTEMIGHPNGDIYVTDGYRNARLLRFTRDGRLVKLWGSRAMDRASSVCRIRSPIEAFRLICRAIKIAFAKSSSLGELRSPVLSGRGERGIWRRRFWGSTEYATIGTMRSIWITRISPR